MNTKLAPRHIVATLVVVVLTAVSLFLLAQRQTSNEGKAGKKTADCFALSIQHTVIAQMKMGQLGCPVTP